MPWPDMPEQFALGEPVNGIPRGDQRDRRGPLWRGVQQGGGDLGDARSQPARCGAL